MSEKKRHSMPAERAMRPNKLQARRLTHQQQIPCLKPINPNNVASGYQNRKIAMPETQESALSDMQKKPVLRQTYMPVQLNNSIMPLTSPPHTSRMKTSEALESGCRLANKTTFVKSKKMNTASLSKRKTSLPLNRILASEERNVPIDHPDNARLKLNLSNEARIKIGSNSYRLSALLDVNMIN